MKKLMTIILLCSNSLALAGDLTIEISNLKNTKGEIFVALWSAPTGFPKDYRTAIETHILKATEPKIVLAGMKPGNYAIAVFHDKNSNNELDTNAMGIPTEAFGFSNNPKLLFGPPSWKKSNFSVTDKPILKNISLKYF